MTSAKEVVGSRCRPLKAVAYGWATTDRAKLRTPPTTPWMMTVSTWKDLRSTRHSLRIVVAKDLADARLLQCITWLSDAPGEGVLAVATRMAPENLVHLKDVLVDDVLNWELPIGEWKARLLRCIPGRDLRILANVVRNRMDLHPLVRIGLIRLALTDPPFRSVNTLAGSLGYAPNTLRKHFRPVIMPWRFQDLIDWFLLLRFGWTGLTNSPKRSVANHYRPPAAKTLDRMAIRLLGHPRSALLLRPDARTHPMLQRLIVQTMDPIGGGTDSARPVG